MMLDWKIWAGLLAAVLIGAAWLYVGHLRAERDLLTRQAETLARENAGLAAEVAANARALAWRETERRRLAAENEALKDRLEKVYANDPESRAWADSLCPDGVLDCLR